MKTRIISAAVAICIAVIALALAHTWVFDLVVAAITVGALYELFKAVGLVKFRAECCVCFSYAAVDCLIGMVHRHDFFLFFNSKLYGFLFVAAMLLLYLKDHKEYTYAVPFTMIGMTLLVSYSLGTLVRMAGRFPDYARFALVITLAGAWLADSGAYFVGSFFGKHKLCPEISPKKTVEGVIGGAVCNGVFLLMIAAVYTLLNDKVTVHLLPIFIAGMLCSVIGLLGDLSASVIKRQTGIKDYGNIMPGHGGIMDRFDSVLLVAPFMYYLFMQGWLVTLK